MSRKVMTTLEPKNKRVYVTRIRTLVLSTNPPALSWWLLSFGNEIAPVESWNVKSLYVQYKKDISKFNFTVGIRQDNYSNFGRSFNPRLAAIYRQNINRSFKFLYGSAFRAPSFREFNASAAGFIKGNSELKPEKINTYEAIVIQKLGSAILNLGFFRSDVSDIIEPNSSNTYMNIGKNNYSGLEAEFQHSFLINNLNTRLSLSRLLNTSRTAGITPKSTASINTNYRLNKFNFNIATFYHSSSTDRDDTNVSNTKILKPYAVTNLKIQYNLKSSLTTSFEIKNLLDKKYETQSVTSLKRFDIKNRTRLAYLMIEYAY